MIIDRSINNSNQSSKRFVKKYISKNPEDFKQILVNCIPIIEKNPDFRVYSSVNERNIFKGVRSFKESQLVVDYAAENEFTNFYINAHNKIYSALAKPSSAIDKKFLLDLDSKDIKDLLFHLELMPLKFGSGISPNFNIIKCYETKNGYHIITDPFNPASVIFPSLEIKKDALLLLWYNEQ